MTRPAGDAKEKLIQAGKKILAEQGFGGLSVRALAAKAKVNLGLVSYYFGGRDALVKQVAQEVYEEFFKDFTLQVEGEDEPLLALRRGLLRLARFARDNRRLVTGLIKDALNGEAQAKAFLLANGPRHGRVLAGLMKRCVKEKKVLDLPMPVLMASTMSVVAMPTLMAEPFAAVAPKWAKGLSKLYIERSLLTDKALEMRVDLILRALQVRPGEKP